MRNRRHKRLASETDDVCGGQQEAKTLSFKQCGNESVRTHQIHEAGNHVIKRRPSTYHISGRIAGNEVQVFAFPPETKKKQQTFITQQ